jgi:hypothetical protein
MDAMRSRSLGLFFSDGVGEVGMAMEVRVPGHYKNARLAGCWAANARIVAVSGRGVRIGGWFSMASQNRRLLTTVETS